MTGRGPCWQVRALPSREFVPYELLTPQERDRLHWWLREHRVDYHFVPVWAQFDFDPATSEWRIPMYDRDTDGRMRLDETGQDVRRHVIRRRELCPLPWPRPVTVTLGGVDISDYVLGVQIGGGDA